MILSFNTNPGSLNISTGYGYAGYHIVTSLQKLGYKVPFKYKSAKVQLNFSQPQFFEFNKDQYQIGYMPWESTELQEGWLETLNQCDEVWATSPWVKKVYENCGVTPPINVYEHGIEDIWKPFKRQRNTGPLRFLHVGEPAPRKAGQMAFEAFVDVFGNDPDYRLTIKSYKYNTIRVYNKYNNIIDSNISNIYNNISIIPDELSTSQMVGVFNSHHCLIYPSWGEGFGFIPLQALASGMPVICTEEWAPYKKFLGPLALKSQYTESPWQTPHPGLMVEPSYEDLCNLLRKTADEYNTIADYYYEQAAEVRREYDWLQLTDNAFSRLKEKF